MTQCQTFPSPEAIRAWANTTQHIVIDGMIQVKHFRDGLYYYFAQVDGTWTEKMSSIYPIGNK